MITAETITLNLKSVNLSDEQFYQLCHSNDDWRIEQTAEGELIIMPPIGAINSLSWFCDRIKVAYWFFKSTPRKNGGISW